MLPRGVTGLSQLNTHLCLTAACSSPWGARLLPFCTRDWIGLLSPAAEKSLRARGCSPPDRAVRACAAPLTCSRVCREDRPGRGAVAPGRGGPPAPPPPRALGSAGRTGSEACTGRDGRSWSGQRPGEGWEQPGLRRSTRRVRKAGLHSPPACCRDGAQAGGSRERRWPRVGRCRREHRVCRAGLGAGGWRASTADVPK